MVSNANSSKGHMAAPGHAEKGSGIDMLTNPGECIETSGIGHTLFPDVLRHKGWRVTRIELPPREAGEDPNVLAPAELEVE
jgi:hypothetical protein